MELNLYWMASANESVDSEGVVHCMTICQSKLEAGSCSCFEAGRLKNSNVGSESIGYE